MKFIYSFLIGFLLLEASTSDKPLLAQITPQPLKKIEKLLLEQGDVFIAVDYPIPGKNQSCLEENSLTNQIQFKNDSAFVNYINYTELFCEAYVLRTQHTYHFSLKDIDGQTMRLVEKRYDYGNGTLKEGSSSWFEVQLFTKDKKSFIRKRELETKQTEFIDTVSLLFKSKEGAKEALVLLKNAVHEVANL